MSDIETLPGGDRWKIGQTVFEFTYANKSTVDRFDLRKPPQLVERYIELCRTFRGAAVVELGIAAGGSTALLALLAEPRKLVSLELDPEPVPALAELIDVSDLTGRVHPYYGVDQADRGRLREILDLEFGEEPIDLVIDDASHFYAETRASFEVLFPRLRPGGLFVIEDWTADHVRYKWVIAAMADKGSPRAAELEQRLGEVMKQREQGLGPFPLHRLAAELMQVCMRDQIIDEVTVDSNWVTVRRGPAPLDPGDFRLRDHHDDDWQWILA